MLRRRRVLISLVHYEEPWDPTETVLTVHADEVLGHTYAILLAGPETWIDWGDGTQDDAVSTIPSSMGSGQALIHTYSNAGDYLVRIHGNYYRFRHTGASSYYPSNANRLVTVVHQIGSSLYDCDGLFSNCQHLTHLDDGCTLPRTLGVRAAGTLNWMFQNCVDLVSLGNSFKLPDAVYDAQESFVNCSKLAAVPFVFPEAFSTNNGKLTRCFQYCHKLTLPATFVLPYNSQYYESAFEQCYDIVNDVDKLIPSNWDSYSRSDVKFMSCFRACSGLIGNAPGARLWNASNITWNSTRYAFGGCTGLSNYSDIPDGWK